MRTRGVYERSIKTGMSPGILGHHQQPVQYRAASITLPPTHASNRKNCLRSTSTTTMRVPTIFLALAASTAAQNPLTDYLSSQPDLSTLLGALSTVPDLVQTLIKAGPNLTILAPTNEAFAAVPSGSEEAKAISSGDKSGISAILAYHVINGTYLSGQVTETADYVTSLLTPNFKLGGVPATNATAGQSVGLVSNGTDVEVISGELMVSKVVQAVRRFHRLDSVTYC